MSIYVFSEDHARIVKDVLRSERASSQEKVEIIVEELVGYELGIHKVQVADDGGSALIFFASEGVDEEHLPRMTVILES